MDEIPRVRLGRFFVRRDTVGVDGAETMPPRRRDEDRNGAVELDSLMMACGLRNKTAAEAAATAMTTDSSMFITATFLVEISKKM